MMIRIVKLTEVVPHRLDLVTRFSSHITISTQNNFLRATNRHSLS